MDSFRVQLKLTKFLQVYSSKRKEFRNKHLKNENSDIAIGAVKVKNRTGNIINNFRVSKLR
jgi:hypothetical protein